MPSYLGAYKTALDRLTDMMLVCKEIKEYYTAQSNEKATKFWTNREQTVLNSLINCALTVSGSKLLLNDCDRDPTGTLNA